jgi:hypothetical protein
MESISDSAIASSQKPDHAPLARKREIYPTRSVGAKTNVEMWLTVPMPDDWRDPIFYHLATFYVEF